jgi:hypothetical protein
VTAREDSRVTVVRPDQVSCCIVPAMSERSASFLLGAARASARSTPGFTQLPPGVGVTQRTKAPLAGVAPYRSRDARRIGLGSTANAFSLPSTRSFEERQGCQTWLESARLGGKKTPVPSESRVHRSAQRRREPPSAPVLPRKGRARGNRTDQGARLIRGNGQKSVVRIFGSSISFASQDVRGATGGSSDDSSHAPCDTSAYRYPQDVGLRLTVRSIDQERGRRERVRDLGDRGVKATAFRIR